MDQPTTIQECALELGELRRKLAALEMENQALRDQQHSSPLPAPPVDQVLARVFTASPTGLAVTDDKGHFLAVNQAYARLHGYAPEELVGRHFTVVVPAAKQQTARARHQDFLAGREPAPDQWDIVRKDGVQVKVFAETGRMVLPDGRCLKVLSLTDVTLLKRTDQRRVFLASIVENSTDMIVGQTLDGAIVSWNKGAEKAFGYKPQEVIGRDISLLVPPELGDEIPRIAYKLGRGEGVDPFDTIRVRKNGERFPVSLTVSLVKNDAGKVIGASAIARDITERKAMEEALRGREERIRAMSQAALDAIIVIDDAGRIDFWNPAAERMFGYTEAEALGQDVHLLITPPEMRAAALSGMVSFAGTGRGMVVNNLLSFMALRKDGTQFPVERAVAAFNLGGRWYAVGSIRDQTERKIAEDRLQELASVDELTGILNRRRFLELAGQAVDRAKRYDRPLSLIMLDVDRFKSVNDTYGHDFGDVVLKTLCRTCRTGLRDVDIFGRLGGEEFAVLLPETEGIGALEAAERLRRAQAMSPIPGVRGDLLVTISLGVAVLSEKTPTLETLLKASDEALYVAKRSGRNRVEMAA